VGEGGVRGRRGDGERGRLGDWETGRLGDGETGRRGDWVRWMLNIEDKRQNDVREVPLPGGVRGGFQKRKNII